MVFASTDSITLCLETPQDEESLFFKSFGKGCSDLQMSISGVIPILLNSWTECWVGFVFNSPAAFMNGTRVKCIFMASFSKDSL